MRAEDASKSASHAVRTEAQPSDKKLSPKQRKKLLKEVGDICSSVFGQNWFFTRRVNTMLVVTYGICA